MPAFRASPLEVRELVRETLAGAGLTEVVTTALVSPRHIETFVLAREVPSTGDEAAAGRRPDRRHQPAVARPLAAAPQPARQPARRRRRQPAPRHGGRRGLRDRQGLRPHRLPSRASGGGSGSRSSAPPSPRPGTARPARTTSTTPRASWSCSRAAWASPRRRYAAETGEALFHPGRTARADAGDRLHALVGELHPHVVDAWELRTAPAGHRRRGRHRRACRRAPGARARPRRRRASRRSSATSRSSCPRRLPAAVVEDARPGARRRPAARRPAVRHLPRRAARGRGEEPRVPAPVRGRGPDADRGRGRGGRRRRRRSAAVGRRPPPGLRSRGPAAGPVGRSSRCGALRRAATLRRGTGRRGFRLPSRGWTRGHRWVHHIAEPVRPAGRPVPVRHVRPGLHPGLDPAGGRHRCR